MKITEKVTTSIKKISLSDKDQKPTEVKMHRRPKTPRKYERVAHVIDFLRVIEKHGEKTAFSYFGKAIAASMPMMSTTTNSSMRVNAPQLNKGVIPDKSARE